MLIVSLNFSAERRSYLCAEKKKPRNIYENAHEVVTRETIHT